MAKPKGKYHSNVSFLDLLFNLVVGFVMLFIIAFLLIRPIAENKQIEQKAEYIISVTWPKEFADDRIDQILNEEEEFWTNYIEGQRQLEARRLKALLQNYYLDIWLFSKENAPLGTVRM